MRLRRRRSADARDQISLVGGIEAIEKEVRDDQIVFGSRQRRGAGVILTIDDAKIARAAASEFQHARAQVDIIDPRVRSRREQSRQRTAIAVSQNQYAACTGNFGQEGFAAAFEGAPESCVF